MPLSTAHSSPSFQTPSRAGFPFFAYRKKPYTHLLLLQALLKQKIACLAFPSFPVDLLWAISWIQPFLHCLGLFSPGCLCVFTGSQHCAGKSFLCSSSYFEQPKSPLCCTWDQILPRCNSTGVNGFYREDLFGLLEALFFCLALPISEFLSLAAVHYLTL